MTTPIAPWNQRDFSGCGLAYVGGFLIFLAVPTIFVLGLLPGLMMCTVPALLYAVIAADRRWTKAARRIHEQVPGERRTIRLSRVQTGTGRYGPIYTCAAHLGEHETLSLISIPKVMFPLLDQPISVRVHRHPDDPSQPVVLAHDQAIMISKRPPWSPKGLPFART